MSTPTIEQRLTTLESQMANTLTKTAGQTIQSHVGSKYSELLAAVVTLTSTVEDLQTRLNDALARIAELEA